MSQYAQKQKETSASNSPPSIDYAGFAQEIDQLRKETLSKIDRNDFDHLRRVEWRGRIFALLGYLTAWIFPNPLSALLLSLGPSTRWAITHHIMHKGYDRIPNIPKRYTSKGFAVGWRRFVDWFDWIHPKAWAYEHNVLHHSHTGGDFDPDLVERYAEDLRKAPVPSFIKKISLFLVGITWKFTYYAPNTISVLDLNQQKPIPVKDIIFVNMFDIFNFSKQYVRKLWMVCYLPYGLKHFVLIPLLFWPWGETIVFYVLLNKILAEFIINFHAFFVIVPNHTGHDLHRYFFRPQNKGQYYAMQVLGSTNYHTGTEFIDHSQMWLNYQIEHHLFPELPISKYRDVQPKVKALCKQYGIPYIQESVFIRFKKMIDICTGQTSMQRLNAFPDPVKNHTQME